MIRSMMASGDGTVRFRIWIDPCVSVRRFILGTEDHRSLLTSGFHDLQQIVGFLAGERTDQPLVKDRQVCFLIRLDGFLQNTASFCHIQLIQKFRNADIFYCFELPTGSVSEGTGNICFPVTGNSFRDGVVTVRYILAGGKTQNL